MPGIYDRLQQALEISKREEGISAIEIMDLPPNLRKVVRLMLREVVMKYTDLCAALESQPAASRLTSRELDAALDMLVEQNWLSRYGSGEFTSYRVNLRRRAGSQLNRDIWSSLDDRISRSRPDQPETPETT